MVEVTQRARPRGPNSAETAAGERGTPNAQSGSVQGTITARDVLRHSLTILRLWGPTCYVRCIKAIVSRRPCTFLEVINTRG